MLEELGREIIVEVAKEALKEPAKEVGSQIADLLRILFTPLQMAKICRDAWLEDFRTRTLKKLDNIPADRLTSPALEIVGPAIEASRFFIQQEQMREYFANLIAHACDNQDAQAVHPAFVFFLTQMTPLDAELIRLFRVETEVQIGASIGIGLNPPPPITQGTGIRHYPEQILPVVNYYLARGSEQRTIYRNVLKISETGSVDTISAAVSNLIRMGLIDVSYTQTLTSNSYEWATQNSIYQELLQYTKEGSTDRGISMRCIRGMLLVEGSCGQLIVEKGIAHLTQLGFNFYKCCILEQEVTNG